MNSPKYRFALKDKTAKSKVMNSKKNLKSNKTTWINDDLTARRSTLAYYARKACKNGYADETWIYDSKVFLKSTGEP